MKTKILLIILSFGLSSAISAQQTPIKVGADKDAHGCISSAGYIYSKLKKECIRTFEQKIQLKDIATKGNYSASVVFNKDQSRAEIFLKEEETSVLLKRTAKSIWKNVYYTLEQDEGFVLIKNKKLIYKSHID